MRVVVCPPHVDLAEYLHASQPLTRAYQAVRHVGHFLAQRTGRGGLAVGAAQHGQVGLLVGESRRRVISTSSTGSITWSRPACSISAC